MIIGNGLIAKAFQKLDRTEALVFASGVSNSLETKPSEYDREFNLLKKSIEDFPNKKLIYFSTLSIADQSKQESPYVIHKKKIEDYIHQHCGHYLILRIGNIVGKGGNPNTLFNFLSNCIDNNSSFQVHNKARRLIIDIDDIILYVQKNLTNVDQQTVNLAFPYYYTTKEIVTKLEIFKNKKATFTEVEEGDFYKVDFSDDVLSYFNGITSDEYLNRITLKYL